MNKHILLLLIGSGLLFLGCKETIVTGLESLIDPNIKPKVIYTYPPMNSQGPYEGFYGNIIFRFNKIMDFSSIRRAVRVSSPSKDVVADTEHIYPYNGEVYYVNTIDTPGTYTYFHRWKIREVGTLRIESSARDVNGNYLDAPFVMTFLPEPFFRVKSVDPANGKTINVAAYTRIYVYFNSPIDTSIFSSLQLSPLVAGDWQFLPYGYIPDSTSVYFVADEGLESGTSYSVTVSENAHDKDWNAIRQQFTSTFRTAAFRVERTYPRDGSEDVELRPSIAVSFTGLIDTASVREAFSIAPAVDGHFDFHSDRTGFTLNRFSLRDPLSPSTMYIVTIDTSMRSKGGIKLAEPYVFSFTTEPLRITNTSPVNGESGVSRSQASIIVSFNSMIDTGSVRSAFRIDPPLSGNFLLFEGYFSFTYHPNVSLKENTRYTVDIDSTMKSKNGARLRAPYTFSFTTGN